MLHDVRLHIVSDVSAAVRVFTLGLVGDAYGTDAVRSIARNVALTVGEVDRAAEVSVLDELSRVHAF